MGNVLLHEPLLTWYCRVEPDGQGVPDGAVISPPEGVHALVQVLFVMLTLSGAPEKLGQELIPFEAFGVGFCVTIVEPQSVLLETDWVSAMLFAFSLY